MTTRRPSARHPHVGVPRARSTTNTSAEVEPKADPARTRTQRQREPAASCVEPRRRRDGTGTSTTNAHRCPRDARGERATGRASVCIARCSQYATRSAIRTARRTSRVDREPRTSVTRGRARDELARGHGGPTRTPPRACTRGRRRAIRSARGAGSRPTRGSRRVLRDRSIRRRTTAPRGQFRRRRIPPLRSRLAAHGSTIRGFLR